MSNTNKQLQINHNNSKNYKNKAEKKQLTANEPEKSGVVAVF